MRSDDDDQTPSESDSPQESKAASDSVVGPKDQPSAGCGPKDQPLSGGCGPKDQPQPKKRTKNRRTREQIYEGLISLGDAAALVAPKRKRTSTFSRFSKFCKIAKVPLPDLVFGEREMDHMDHCLRCQKTWPMYVYRTLVPSPHSRDTRRYLFKYEHGDKIPMEQVAQQWCKLSEAERARQHAILSRIDARWLKAMVHGRVATAFHLFSQHQRATNPQIRDIKDFSERVKTLSAMWKIAPADERSRFEDASAKLRADHKAVMTSLPEYKVRQIERERRRIRAEKRKTAPSKPANSYMLYLADQWNAEKAKPNPCTYKDLVKEVSRRWESELTEEQKQPYVNKFKVARDRYFADKLVAEQRMKAARAARTASIKKAARAAAVDHIESDSDDEAPAPKKHRSSTTKRVSQ